MVEDKYIGLALAVSSSLAIGTSFIITKKVQNLHKDSMTCRTHWYLGTQRRQPEFGICERVGQFGILEESNMVGRDVDP